MPVIVLNNTADTAIKYLPIPLYSSQETTNRFTNITVYNPTDQWVSDKSGYVNVCIKGEGRDGMELLTATIFIANKEVVRAIAPKYLLLQRKLPILKGQTVRVDCRAQGGAWAKNFTGFCYFIPPVKRW